MNDVNSHLQQTDPRSLAALIERCMRCDQHRLMRRLRSVSGGAEPNSSRRAGRGGRPGREGSKGGGRSASAADGREGGLARLSDEIERSIRRREARAERVPKVSYPADLPVVQRREEIAAAIAAHQVVVVCGETGSGKTTQLPKICMELGRGVAGMIGHTQPRRIAARSVAARLAEELGTPLGGRGAVGYKVRFGDKTGPDTYVKLMTDGILLAETQGDRFLDQYDTLIIDEAHERSLNIDFLLGYVKQLLPRRPDLKVIVTSATIDPERFSEHFGGAPIIEVSGRTYPVEVRHRPLAAEDEDEQDRGMEGAILDAVDELAREGQGDVLVFLSGEREIRETAEALRKHHPPGTEILPLYARLSAAEQMRVFQPHPGRRIVLSTNVAETSLTVPGIRYVVDPGYARISRYSARTKVQRLEVEPVSRASADQRKGRCGRVAEGVCIRLYSEEDFQKRPRFTDPEILRTNLASVILQMTALRLGDVERFPFLEPPDARMIRDGYETLQELGAVDEGGKLTRIGAELARLPIDPRIGRMILAANTEACLDEVLVIASALSVQDPRERPLDAQDRADEAHAQFRHEDSDFLAYLNLWRFYREHSRRLSGSKLRKLCRQNFLSYMRMREWADVHRQLHALVTEMGHRPNATPADEARIHRALLTGLLSNVGFKADPYEYTGARGTKFNIFPGSGLFKKGPKWVMAAELVRTTKLYARCVAKIEPQWIEELGAHLIKRSYSDPHWTADAGRVAAFERVSFYGLELVARRRVHYGPIDPATSRQIFIHHALVEGELRGRPPFLRHNADLVEQVKDLEAKLRRSDLLADAQRRFAFYDARLPDGVTTVGQFERWRREAERAEPRLLFMHLSDLMAQDVPGSVQDLFPDALDVNGTSMPLEYHLEHGHPEDGVTLVTPIEALNLVDPVRSEWLVPGLLRDKLVALIKGLPKQIRVSFVPAPRFAERAMQRIEFGKGPLLDAVGKALGELAGVQIPRDAWRPDALPDHLRMNFRVVDAKGKILASGRDLEGIRRALADQMRSSLTRLADTAYKRDGLTDWDFGDLPERVEVLRSGMELRGFPALLDAGQSVSLRLVDSPETAAHLTRAGLRRLFLLQVRREVKSLVDHLPGVDRMALHAAALGGAAQLREELMLLIAERAFLADAAPVRTEAEFRARLERGWGRLGAAASEAATLVSQVLAGHHALAVRLAGPAPAAWAPTLADIREQLGRLVYKGFLAATPPEWLVHLPRFLRAIEVRLQKLGNAGLQRDTRAMAQVLPYWRAYIARARKHAEEGIDDEALRHYRWMVEEMRVSAFAQELRTSIPVSTKRLDEQWARTRA